MQAGCPRCGHVLEYSSQPPRFCANCGQPLIPPHSSDQTRPFEPPTQAHVAPSSSGSQTVPKAVGGYRLLRKLGEGGMGTVYEGESIDSGRKAAVKLIRPEFADSPETLSAFAGKAGWPGRWCIRAVSSCWRLTRRPADPTSSWS